MSRRWVSNLEMCHYGAEQYRAGKCDEVRFDIMKSERAEVYQIMMHKYPDVKFSVTYPEAVPSNVLLLGNSPS